MKIDKSLLFQCLCQHAPVHINLVHLSVCTNSTPGMISSNKQSGTYSVAFDSSITADCGNKKENKISQEVI